MRVGLVSMKLLLNSSTKELNWIDKTMLDVLLNVTCSFVYIIVICLDMINLSIGRTLL